MSHELTPHVIPSEVLGPRDRSRYSQVIMAVTRNSNGTATVSATTRVAGNGHIAGVRLGVATIPMPPGSLQSTDPWEALYLALAELTGRLPQ